MMCQIAEVVAYIGIAAAIGIALSIIPAALDFSDFCECVAKMQGRSAEIESPVSIGEGYSKYRTEIYYLIDDGGHLQFEDPLLRQRGEYIRKRYHRASRYLVVVLLLCVVPTLMMHSSKFC